MPVNENQLTPEQRSQERAIQETDEKAFASKLADSMDLPSTLAGDIDAHIKSARKDPKEVEEEESEEQEDPEVPADEIDEAESEAESEESEDSDDDLIPKSKVQKRFDEMTAQLKRLEAKLAQKDEEIAKVTPPKSSDEEQLEAMSESELKALKRQVRLEQIKSGSDESKVAQLMDLEEKIDNTIRTAPQRFNQNQVKYFEKAVEDTSYTIKDFDKVKGEIFNYAKTIFAQTPELQGSVRGQERAWKFAVDHFTALNKISEGKSTKNELERQVNTLKKKISVDNSSKKGNQQNDSDASLKRKAIHGTDADKTKFLKTRINTDSLVSDDVLEGLGQNRR